MNTLQINRLTRNPREWDGGLRIQYRPAATGMWQDIIIRDEYADTAADAVYRLLLCAFNDTAISEGVEVTFTDDALRDVPTAAEQWRRYWNG